MAAEGHRQVPLPAGTESSSHSGCAGLEAGTQQACPPGHCPRQPVQDRTATPPRTHWHGLGWVQRPVCWDLGILKQLLWQVCLTRPGKPPAAVPPPLTRLKAEGGQSLTPRGSPPETCSAVPRCRCPQPLAVARHLGTQVKLSEILKATGRNQGPLPDAWGPNWPRVGSSAERGMHAP